MSPEFSRVRKSKGWAIHERNRRKTVGKQSTAPIMQAKAIVAETPPNPRSHAWDVINGTIQRSFEGQPDLIALFGREPQFFRRFFDGRYDISMGIGPTNFQALIQEYLEDPSSPKHNPNLFDQAGPILKTITAETDRMSPAKRLGGIRK